MVNLPIRIGDATYGYSEIMEILDSLVNRKLTMGEKVLRFERMWADYIGVKHAILTTSGSCANLLQLSALTTGPFGKIARGSEVITGAVNFGTTVSSIAQAGLTPVLVDVREDFNIDPRRIEAAITEKTVVIMPVHMLGGPCEMDTINEIAEKHGLIVIEDSCEAHGAEYKGKKTGSIGLSGSFSNYWSHHITTAGEGGIITTNSDEMDEAIRCLRAWGWLRGIKESERHIWTEKYPNVDARHFFVAPGYNFKPNELQAAFGIHQIPRIEACIAHKRENFKWFNENLPSLPYCLLPRERSNTRHVSLFYGFWVDNKRGLIEHLERNSIETRSIEASNFVAQPAFQQMNARISGRLPVAEAVDRMCLGFGNHDYVREEEREYIAEKIWAFYK